MLLNKVFFRLKGSQNNIRSGFVFNFVMTRSKSSGILFSRKVAEAVSRFLSIRRPPLFYLSSF